MKVAIVGLADTGTAAPWDDAAWEVWGLNGGHLRQPGFFLRPDGLFRADRWFQIHPPAACDAKELDWLEKMEAVTQDGYAGIPTYVRPEDMDHWVRAYPTAAEAGVFLPFPITDVMRRFPTGWFANTFCLEVALALHLGATSIGLYGVECGGYGREVAVERPAVAYWMGVATGLGVEVVTPDGCTLRYTTFDVVYGFTYEQEALEAAQLTGLLLPKNVELDSVNLDTVEAVAAAIASAGR